MSHPIPSLSIGSIDITDYNNDGWKDIAICGYSSLGPPVSYIFKNNGNFNFVDISAGLRGMYSGELSWGDYNHDSLPDLVINGTDGINFRVRFYRNLGSDVFAEALFTFPGTAGTIDWIDYNLDGIDDLLISGVDSSSAHNVTALYQNDSAGNFILIPTNIPDFGEPSAVTVADFNNDSIQDICLVGGNGTFSSFSVIAYGMGSATFNLVPLPQALIDNLFIEAADIDSDGDWDLVMSTYILRNDGTTTGLNAITKNVTEVILYPNPTTSELNILSDQKMHSFQIHDLHSRLISENKNSVDKIKVYTQNLPAGLYSLRMVLNDGKTVHKLFQVSH